MTIEEKKVIAKAICILFVANNKAVTITLGDCPGIETAKILAESISREIFESYEILNTLIQLSCVSHTGREMSIKEFVHSPRMGG